MTSNDDGWIKARASSGGGDCVEMRQAGEVVQVRDSKLGPFSRSTPWPAPASPPGSKAPRITSSTP